MWFGWGSCRYQGRREETNMVIINIKLLSGYVLDQNSLKQVSSVCPTTTAVTSYQVTEFCLSVPPAAE